jgi:hypothetical protein
MYSRLSFNFSLNRHLHDQQDRKQLFDLGHVPHRSLPHDHELNTVMDGHNQVVVLVGSVVDKSWL